MPDRFKYSEVRQKIINALRTDLMGPQSENEILDENPKSSYIIGMLASQTEEKEASTAGEQEVDSDIAYGDSEDYTAGEDDDNEPIMTTSFKLPTSIGISFYIASSTKTINIDVKWGDYVRSVEKRVGKDVLITGYSLSGYFADLVDVLIEKSQKGIYVKFFVNNIENQKGFDKLCRYKGRFLHIYNFAGSKDSMAALHAKVISVDEQQTLITSANLSYHGQEGNIELGTLVDSKKIARQVDDVFTHLIFNKIVQEI